MGTGRAWAKRSGRWVLAVVAATAAAAGGCSKEPTTDTPGAAKTGPAPTAGPATVPTAGVNPSATADVAAPGTTPTAAEPGGNALFTLPPSRGPAPHQFKPVTLFRSGPSGDLEMQLTGDGIYRIRDHGRGKSYAGDGKLTDAQIAEWAAAMKDWDSLKDKYVPTDAPAAEADTVEIIYGGKKVVASSANKDTPATFTGAYQRLLGLNEQSKKEADAAQTAAPAQGATAKPAEPSTKPAEPVPAPAGGPQGVTPKQ